MPLCCTVVDGNQAGDPQALSDDDFDWEAFGKGSWPDEFPGLRKLLDEKAAEQKEKRDSGKEG